MNHPSDQNLANNPSRSKARRNSGSHDRTGWHAAQATGISGTGGETEPSTHGVLGGPIHEEPQDSDPADGDDSDNSMRVRRTPSSSSSDAEKTSHKLGRISLDGATTKPGDDMTQHHSSTIPPTTSKRSATEDLNNPPRKHLTPSSRGLRGASNVKKSAPRGRGSYARAGQRTSLPRQTNTSHGAYKPILPRDSGYDTGKSLPPSRQHTSQLPQSQVPPATQEPLVPSTPSSPKSEVSAMISQPASSPLSQQQLASEIKGIYAGLVMVEGKCINIDAAQAQANTPLGPEQWQALIALHRTLLYEHHDFMMATQHPVATDALKKLAVKYQMPARMWKHAIHAFLEVLRQRRPESHEYMLAFVYLAYQMMALLYETVPDFRDTWIECLGDLARYRMAIEDDKDVQHQWGNVASFWYNLTADANPGTGRLSHHLGILESPSLRKLYFYVKALTALHSFQNGHESLATFFRSLLQEGKPKYKGTTVSRVMRFHAQAYSGANESELKETATEAFARLNSENTVKLREWGVYLVISNVGLLLEYGNATNFLTQAFSNAILAGIRGSRPSSEAVKPEGRNTKTPQPLLPGTTFSPQLVTDFVYESFNNILSLGTDRQSVRDILPGVHVILVWFYSLHSLHTMPEEGRSVDTSSLLMDPKGFSWAGLCDCLNTLTRFDPIPDEVTTTYVHYGTEFDLDVVSPDSKLPEDFALSGLLWSQGYCPVEYMPASPDAEMKLAETPNTHIQRVFRVQSLAMYLASRCEVLTFDEGSQQFTAPKTKNMALRSIQPVPPGLAQNAWRDQPPSPVSHSSAATTYSANSDSEGWGVVSGRGKKGKKAYAGSASKAKAPSFDFDKMALDDQV